MFELNPLGHPDAWWQHILMVAVAALLGYLIGYRSGKDVISELEEELSDLDIDLYNCRNESENKKGVVTLTTDTYAIADNFKMIEGIGPKIEQLLKAQGIKSFRQLSQTSPEWISEILKNAGPRFQMHEPATWPRQAELAANGEWDRLQQWQDELDKGRE
jgi:hypothetical protein